MTNLTDKWKKGNLDNGFYYIETDDKKSTIDYYSTSNYRFFTYPDERVMKVLAPVPSFEQWRLMQDDNKRLKHDVGNLGYKIKNQRKEIDNRLKEIEKLKELLKECSYRIDWTDKTGHKPTDDGRQKLFDAISQVLANNQIQANTVACNKIQENE